MRAIFLKELKLSRKGLLIWSSIMFGLAAFGGIEFIALKDSLDVLVTAIDGFSPIIRIVFGINVVPLNTVEGIYICMHHWYSLVAYAFSVYLGVFLIAKDEYFKTAEFLYTKPYKRSTILISKIWVGIVNQAILVIVMVITTIIFILYPLDAIYLSSRIILMAIGMFLSQLVFFTIGMFCASFLKNYATALRYSFATLITFYVIAFSIEYFGMNVSSYDFLSPVRYFYAPFVINDGIRWIYLILTGVIASIGSWSTLFVYKKRDIYV